MDKRQMISALQKKYPSIVILRDDNGWIPESDNTFGVSAEHGTLDGRGYDLFNYWTENHTHYDLGISMELVEFLQGTGWYAEWVNPGVVAFVQE